MGSRAREAGGAATAGPPPSPDPGDGLVTGVARAVLATGEAGVRLAAHLAGEAVRRLPKP